MEGNEVEWIGRLFEFFAWLFDLAGGVLGRLWRQLVKLQSEHPQRLESPDALRVDRLRHWYLEILGRS